MWYVQFNVYKPMPKFISAQLARVYEARLEGSSFCDILHLLTV